MTNHEQEPEPNPLDVDAHDPVVAAQFELLNGVTPPDPVVVERPMVAGATASSGRRSFVLATAAAAAVLVIGLAAFAVSRGGGDTVDVAGELPTADDTDGASEPGDTDGDVGELVVSTTTSDAAEEALDLASDDDAEDAGDGSDDDQSEAGSDDDDASVDSDDDNSEPGDSDPPSTDDEAIPLPDNGTGKDSSVDDRVGQVVTIRGVITEVMLDCNSHVKLNEKGEIVNDGAVMCDGGNFIVVDGRTIFTTSGYVAESMAFNKHPEWIKPGQRVVVTAMQEPGGWTHLDCDRCQIRMG